MKLLKTFELVGTCNAWMMAFHGIWRRTLYFDDGTTNDLVFAFAQVIKCTPVSGGGRQRKSLAVPQTTKQPRVVCVTVQRRGGAPGFKASLHVCKKTSSSMSNVSSSIEYEIRKSYRLKNVTKLETFDTAHQAYPTCQITFGKHGKLLNRGVDSKIAFECPTEEIRTEMLGVVYSFCRSHENIVPELVGLTRKDLGLFGEFSDEEDVEEDEEDDTNDGILEGNALDQNDGIKQEDRSKNESELHTPVKQNKDGEKASVRRSRTELKSSLDNHQLKETKQTPTTAERLVRRVTTLPGWRDKPRNKSIETIRADILLDAISDGANSLEDACAKISLELQALDDANTHELLEMEDSCTRMNNDLFTTLGYLDDLEETIAMFDTKLKHLSDDILTIDESSSYLKDHSRNNAVLLETIDSLLDICILSPDIEHVLIENEISTKNLDRIVNAFQKLHSKIEILEKQGNAKESMAAQKNDQTISMKEFYDMRVVKDAVKHMKDVQREFLNKAVSYYDAKIDASLSSRGEYSQGSKELLQIQMHETISLLTPLLGLIYLVDPHVAEAKILKYIEKTNQLLKQEVMESLSAMQQQQYSRDSKNSKVGKELLTKVDSMMAMERVQSQSVQLKNKFHASSKTYSDSLEQKSSLNNVDGEVMKHIQGRDVSNIFQSLVSSLIPRMRNEISVLIDVLHKSGILTVENFAVRSLLEGIGLLLSECIMSIKSSRGLGCLDITGTLQSNLLKLPTDSPYISLVHDMIVGSLQECEKYWNSFGQEIEKAIRKYEARSGQVSSLHILPFVVNFESIANNMEAIVTEWTSKDLNIPRSLHKQSQEANGIDSAQMPTGSMPGMLLRRMADELYQRVLPTIFKVIEGFSQDHEKYKERIRLENYAFLRISLQSLPVKSSHVLKEYSSASADGRNDALNAYVNQIMADSELIYFLNIDSENHAKIYEQFSNGPSFEQTLSNIVNKIRKDIGDTSFLMNVIWERIDTKLLQSLDSIEASDSSRNDIEIIETQIRPALSRVRSGLFAGADY